MAPQVFNIRHGNSPRGTVYIGRGSPWGNPFTVKEHGRDEAINLYKMWIMKPDQNQLRREMREQLKGKDLECYCAPKPCHGDVILGIANA